jgi:hypothetical protein
VDPSERLDGLRQTQVSLRAHFIFEKAQISDQISMNAFVESMLSYEIIPHAERELYDKGTSSVTDPGRRREVKLKQWKKEKELAMQIEVSLSCNSCLSSLANDRVGASEEARPEIGVS